MTKGNIDFRGKAVHVLIGDVAQTNEFKRAARRHGAKVVESRSAAQILVVDDVASPGQKATWAAAMNGATVVSSQIVLSAGQAGPYVTYRPAVAIRRWIWMSVLFRERHPVVSGIITEAATSHRSLWRLIVTRDAFVAKATSSRQKRIVFGLVSAHEKNQAGGS